MENVITEITRTVWATEGGISVSPDQDGLGEIRIFPADQWSKSNLADIDFTIPSEMAKALGEAIIATANELLKEKK